MIEAIREFLENISGVRVFGVGNLVPDELDKLLLLDDGAVKVVAKLFDLSFLARELKEITSTVGKAVFRFPGLSLSHTLGVLKGDLVNRSDNCLCNQLGVQHAIGTLFSVLAMAGQALGTKPQTQSLEFPM